MRCVVKSSTSRVGERYSDRRDIRWEAGAVDVPLDLWGLSLSAWDWWGLRR